MVEYILGNYLVESGKITKEQLKMTMEKQDSVRVKLGLIAVAEGMMTLEQADEVNRLQAVMDKRFGDIAVTKGYLTDEQIGKLLKKQGNSYLSFIQTLVDEGLVTMEEIDWLINDFRQENGYSNSEIEAFKSDDVDRIVPLLVPEEGKQFTEIISVTVRTLIRLIDRHIYIGKAAMVDAFPSEGQVSQALEGEGGMIDCFSERDGALLKVCSVFGQEEFQKIDLDSLDAAGELLNCVNGLYVSSLSRQGSFLELMPPEYEDATPKAKKAICRIPIFVGECGLYFTVAELS
ncbi:MAG: hypothetical protein J6C84_01770 [Lachnospiraceae bacterium]|nr:hypothetical protein [Lachnospiraceae bacterium]